MKRTVHADVEISVEELPDKTSNAAIKVAVADQATLASILKDYPQLGPAFVKIAANGLAQEFTKAIEAGKPLLYLPDRKIQVVK